MAQDLIELFKTHAVDYQTTWEEIRSKIDSTDAFRAIPSETDRKKIFEVRICIHFIIYIRL